MMKRNQKPIMIAVLALLLASMATWAINRQLTKTSPVKEVKTFPEAPRVYDTVLLKKLDLLLGAMDFNKTAFTYEGRYNIEDGQDTTNNIRDLQFLFCRSGKDFYTRLGHTETINENGANVFIQHDQKRVVVSARDYQVVSPISGLAALLKTAKSEDYALESKTAGPLKVISLRNEHHITCKELAVTYDTTQNVIRSVLLRFTDFDDPLNKKLERKVRIDFTRTAQTARIRNYPGLKDIIREDKGNITLVPKFSSYELIKL